jgi:hypothetical protein
VSVALDSELGADEALAGPIVISLREARLVVERILNLAPLEPGLTPAVGDVVLYSQRLGLGGFRALLDGYTGLSCGTPPSLGDRVACHGAHAWVVAPGLADLAVEQAFSGGGTIHVTDIAAASELAVLPSLAARHGVTVQVSVTAADDALIHAAPAGGPPGPSRMDAVMWQMVRAGFPVLGSLWWQLYHLSNTALAPDNAVSRRHAGHLIVQADGSVVGRRDIDDDTDLRLFQTP